MKTKLFLILLAGLFLCVCCKEDKVEPAHFEMEVPPMHFTEAASAATFSITSNIVWKVAVTTGSAWCSVTPAEARTNATVKVAALANPLYLQERTATITVTAGDYSKEITITQAPKPCPTFSAGAIAATGQTVTIGGTPTVIASTQDAAGADTVFYQWYKNGAVISGATNNTYTPPITDAATTAAYTYTRLAKDNICSTTFTPSTGSWVLTVICPVFDAGAISAIGQTVTIGSTPTGISSVQDATSTGTISYQWYKNGTEINGATNTTYTPPITDAATTAAHTYTRLAKDNICSTTFTPSTGSWILTVVCPTFDAGAIAATGQTVTIGSTPTGISSVQDATSTGTIFYQWYKNGTAINGATNATYTPPLTDATAASAHTYTRYAKDNICNTTFTSSTGSWVLTVTCPTFDAGAISATGQTIDVGGTPIVIASTQNATSTGTVMYQWYKNGVAISGATNSTYTPPVSDANLAGIYTYTRRVKDNICNTTFTPSSGSWVLTIVCPAFDAGVIATGEQTIAVSGTPIVIANTQNATSAGMVTYQWYKNGAAISGAINPTYTPSATDVNTAGVYTYTRRVKDNICNTTFTPSTGSWVLRVISCNFTAGAIASTGQVVGIGGTPTMINNTQSAGGGDEVFTYQWYKNGAAISGATNTTYTPPATDATTAGVYTYIRYAKDNTCNTTLTPSTGSWVLTVNGFIPTLSTQAATNIAAGSATVNGTILNTGTPAYTVRGFCYSTVSNPTTADTKTTTYGSGTGTYTTSLTGLVAGSTYYVRAYAINTAGTAYGNEITFTTTATGSALLASVSTNSVANIDETFADVLSTISSAGVPAYTERGVCYSTASNPTISNAKVVAAGAGVTGNYTVKLTGLTPGTKYYVRAYALNTAGIAYGNEGSLTTLKICTTPSTLNLGTVSFVSGPEVTIQGDGFNTGIHQVWSQPVTATGCQKTSFNGGTAAPYNADCRNNTVASYGDLFSGCAVKQNAALLCKNGWRVPVHSDFCNLIKAVNGTQNCGTDPGNFPSGIWGNKPSGGIPIESAPNSCCGDYFWSGDNSNINQGSKLSFHGGLQLKADNILLHFPVYYGGAVRCIK